MRLPCLQGGEGEEIAPSVASTRCVHSVGRSLKRRRADLRDYFFIASGSRSSWPQEKNRSSENCVLFDLP